MPGLPARSPVGTHERQPIHVSHTRRCFSPSLSHSLPLSLKNKINKTIYFKKEVNKVKGGHWLGLSPSITGAYEKEEEIGPRHMERSPCEDTGREWPSVSPG